MEFSKIGGTQTWVALENRQEKYNNLMENLISLLSRFLLEVSVSESVAIVEERWI